MCIHTPTHTHTQNMARALSPGTKRKLKKKKLHLVHEESIIAGDYEDFFKK